MTPGTILKAVFKICIALITLLFLQANSLHAEPLTPVEVVKIFIAGYGTGLMDKAAEVTTSSFRENKPKSVWVTEVWKLLKGLEYAHTYSKVVDTEIKEKKAIVLVDAEITTKAADAKQKEIYTLVRKRHRWLIDDLIVTNEKVDLEDYEL